MRETDKNFLPIDEDVFAEKYAKLVTIIARKYYLEGGDYDDLVQEGMIGLINAMRRFDGEKSDNFEAFAAMCIKRKIYDAIRKTHRKNGDLVLTDLNCQLEHSDTNHYNPETQFLANESAKEIELALGTVLSRFESSVAKIYLCGLSSGEIADILGKPKKSVENAIVRIRKKAESLLQHGRIQE